MLDAVHVNRLLEEGNGEIGTLLETQPNSNLEMTHLPSELAVLLLIRASHRQVGRKSGGAFIQQE
jgi:hypothetical protein